MLPVRLRDFIEDIDGWIYAVSTYDNSEKIGCVLRYVPDICGERVSPSGTRYKKYDFEDAYAFIACHKPQYSDLVQRIPHKDVKRILKPEMEILHIADNHPRVQKLLDLFRLPEGTIGCTGSLLCGLENETSDIDMVVYGNTGLPRRNRSDRESSREILMNSPPKCGIRSTKNAGLR